MEGGDFVSSEEPSPLDLRPPDGGVPVHPHRRLRGQPRTLADESIVRLPSRDWRSDSDDGLRTERTGSLHQHRHARSGSHHPWAHVRADRRRASHQQPVSRARPQVPVLRQRTWGLSHIQVISIR